MGSDWLASLVKSLIDENDATLFYTLFLVNSLALVAVTVMYMSSVLKMYAALIRAQRFEQVCKNGENATEDEMARAKLTSGLDVARVSPAIYILSIVLMCTCGVLALAIAAFWGVHVGGFALSQTVGIWAMFAYTFACIPFLIALMVMSGKLQAMPKGLRVEAATDLVPSSYREDREVLSSSWTTPKDPAAKEAVKVLVARIKKRIALEKGAASMEEVDAIYNGMFSADTSNTENGQVADDIRFGYLKLFGSQVPASDRTLSKDTQGRAVSVPAGSDRDLFGVAIGATEGTEKDAILRRFETSNAYDVTKDLDRKLASHKSFVWIAMIYFALPIFWTMYMQLGAVRTGSVAVAATVLMCAVFMMSRIS